MASTAKGLTGVAARLTLVPAARLAHGLRRIRYIINLAHFKGHMVAGFGGVIMNLAMGLAAKAASSRCTPSPNRGLTRRSARACGDCVDYCSQCCHQLCPVRRPDGPGCTGCGGCLAICKQNAIKIDWNAGPRRRLQLKMVEYARAVLLERELIHLNFCLNVTPTATATP